MPEIPLAYWNELARQFILISALLGGFSIAVVANLIVYDSNNRIATWILKAATVAAGCFLIALFAMTGIILITTPGYPKSNVVTSDLLVPRVIGVAALVLGLISLCTVISLAGWIKSRSTGIFTTIIGVLTFLMILIMSSS